MEDINRVDFNDDEKFIYTPEDWDEDDNEGREGYTGKDFLDLCEGDRALADRVFHACEWQHPETVLEEMQREDDED